MLHIYICNYSISHLPGKPQGPLFVSSVVGVLVAGAPEPEPCFVPEVIALSPILVLVVIDGPVAVVVAAAAWLLPVCSDTAAVAAPPSSHWQALATTP